MTSHDNMRFKLKSCYQPLCLIVSAIALISVVYHGVFTQASGGTNGLKHNEFETVSKWQDRAPRSLNRDYEMDYSDSKGRMPSVILNTMVATATAKPATTLNDIFISVKTTKNFHRNRLDVITKTWLNLAKEQTWFFTDTDDSEYNAKTGGRLVNTNCSASHNRKALCCKMSREFDAFLESNKRWWCHFDDDNYVNIPALVRTLELHNPLQDWYLGKPSIRAPLEIMNKDSVSEKISFWFATGGAGFCVSRSLALKMMPIAGGGKFISVGDKIRLPDDVTMGYIIEHLLGKKLTLIEEFHSHLEPLRFLNSESIANQISFSYSKYGSSMNSLTIDGLPERVDPTRFLSLHCKLFPQTNYCKN